MQFVFCGQFRSSVFLQFSDPTLGFEPPSLVNRGVTPTLPEANICVFVERFATCGQLPWVFPDDGYFS